MGERIGTLVRNLDRTDQQSNSGTIDLSFEKERRRVLSLLHLVQEKKEDQNLEVSSHLGFLPRHRMDRSTQFSFSLYNLLIVLSTKVFDR